MKLTLTWKTKTGQFDSGESLWLGAIRLGGYSFNASRPRESKNDTYTGHIDLPSLKQKEIFADSKLTIKAVLIKQVEAWFAEALSKIDLSS